MNDAASRFDSVLTAIQSLWTGLIASLADGRVGFALVVAVLLTGICWLAGSWIARLVGVLDEDAPLGEDLGVGLASGLLVFTSLWAAMFSGGRSVFVPVAVAFVAAVAWGIREAIRSGSLRLPRPSLRKSQIPGALIAMCFVIAIGFLYGATIAPSPRGEEQPVAFHDAAYYSVLGADLAATGTESAFSTSGFEELPGMPDQTWYHWGELWLSAAVITITGLDPTLARHYVALPVILLAAAALTGTLVRRLAGSPSRAAFLFGVASCLFLAPIPIPGSFFSLWPTGMVFLITMYGLSVVSALFGLHLLSGLGRRRSSMAGTVFSGAVVASLLPTHVVVAVLGFAALATIGALRTRAILFGTSSMPPLSVQWRDTLNVTGSIVVMTVIWAAVTGHGFAGTGTSDLLSSFDAVWWQAIALVILGAGIYLAIPFVLVSARPPVSRLWWICAGALAAVLAGAGAWGARVGDFNMFHVFYGAIAVIATPVAAIAARRLWDAARGAGRVRIAGLIFVLCGAQLGLGVMAATFRLLQFGPHAYEPMPLTILAAIEHLPTDAKIAYSCGELEEVAVWDARLLDITAQTDRRVIPMCFQGDFLGWQVTRRADAADVMNPLFQLAPQRELYPDADAKPSFSRIEQFMETHAIDYIYVDADHPNALVPDAIRLASHGEAQLLKVP